MSKRIVSFTACCIFFLVCCLSGCNHTSETTENTHPVETTDTTQTLVTETPETPETTYDSSEIVTSVPQRNYYKTLIHNGDEYTFYIYENEYASFSVLSDIVTDKEELIIPAEVEGIRISKISYAALSSLTTVKKLVLSEGIEQLEPNFPIQLCETLEELCLPASLQIIGSGYENAEDFQGNGLFAGKGIYVDAENPWYCDVNGILFTKDMSILLKCPDNMNMETYTIPNGTRVLYSFACLDSSVQNLILPEGLLAIKEHALTYCSSVRKLHIPASVIRIDKESLPAYLTEITVSPDNPNFSVKEEDGKMSLYNKYGDLIYTTQPISS